MKKLLLVLLLCLSAISRLAAQNRGRDTVDLKKQLGKTATVCDYVRGIKIVSDSLTLLSMGGIYPRQKFIISIEGNRIQLDWANLKGKHVCVTGVLISRNGQLQIAALEPKQVTIDN